MNQKLKNYPFWGICISFCLGAFCSSFSNNLLLSSIIGFFIFLPFTIYLLKKETAIHFLILTNILFFILGVFRHQLVNPKYNPNHITNIVQSNNPKRLVLRVKEVFKESNKSRKYKVQLHNYDNKKTDGYALLSVQKNDTIPKLKLGDTFITYSKLKPFKKTDNPYAFEYTDYLKNKGITYKLWLTNQQLYQIKSISPPWNLFFNNIKHRIEVNLKKQALSPDVLQITEALVLGNKSNLNHQLKSSFSKAGVIHILAISGLHIGILFFILNGVFSLCFPYSKNDIYATISIVCILWLFTWFSGSSPSALRATTMFTCFQISKSILRHQHPINALFLSILILVLINPNIVFSVGFQLSVTAVGGIIIGVPKLLSLWYPKYWITNKIWSIACMSFCAQVGVLPLSIYYFHQFSTLFLLANIPIMLLIVFLLSGAILVVFLSYFNQVPSFIINLYNYLIQNLISYVNWVVELDVFIIEKSYITSISVILIYLLYAYFMYTYKNYNKAIKWSLPILSMTLLIGLWEYNQRLFKSELWLLNNYNNTIITELTSEKIKIHSKETLTANDIDYNLEPIIGSLHYSNIDTLVLQNSYKYQNKSIHIINSKNQLPISKNDIVILDQSPKINLERLLKIHNPQLIIASARNYTNLLKKWKATCSKEQVAFHSITENGALNLTDIVVNQ